VAVGTAFGEVDVIAGKRSGVKETFVASFLKSDNRSDPSGESKEANEKKGQLSRFDPAIKRKVALISSRDPFLRFFRVSHWQLVIEERYKGMPRRQDDKEKREGDMDKEPVMQPAMEPGLEIEQATLVTPALDLFYPVIIRGRHPQPDKAESIGGELATPKSESVTAAGLEIRQNLVFEKSEKRQL
jgi:hypothetical protein